MTANRSLERQLADYYSAQAPYRAPDRVLAAALTTIESTPQRRVLRRVPWRFTYMSNFAKLAAAGIAVIAVLAIGWAFYVNNQGIGSQPTPTPTPIPTPTPTPTPTSEHTASPTAGPTVGSAGPALTETYASVMHGITVSYPSGWEFRAASEPWRTDRLPLFPEPPVDVIYDPLLTDHLFLATASQSLGGRSVEEWAASILALEQCDASVPVEIDGAPAVMDANCQMAFVSVQDRGYMILLYVSGDDPSLGEVYNLDLFEEILATVELEPSAAVQVSDPFVPAFTFSFPAEAEFDYGAVNETYFEVRVPAFADAGMPSGVIVQAIGAGRADPCDAASERLEIDPGPQSVIDYLKTIPDLALTDEAATTVGGLPAVQATVTGASDTLACDEIYAWVEETETFSAIPLDGPRRLVAVDVGGEHVVLTVFGEDGNPSWPPMAAELIDSITFD